ncbi:MAG: transposase [Planctomycetota bacterium]|jgi:transposase-like protein
MVSRKRYSKEFKLRAARLVVEQGYSNAEAARQLGTTPYSIKEWVKKFRFEGILPPAGQIVPEAEELKKLRVENKKLQMENEILKKAAAYFAKESL